jgi:hypothetical protein
MTTVIAILISFMAGAIALAIAVLVIDHIERSTRHQKKDDWS